VRGELARRARRRGVTQDVHRRSPEEGASKLSCRAHASPGNPVLASTLPKGRASHGQKPRGKQDPPKLERRVRRRVASNCRYLYFAKHAALEGHPDIAGLFRDTAKARPATAHGHLDFPQAGGRPGDRQADRQHPPQSAERHPRRDLRVHRDVPGLRKAARNEGFEEIAEWFETLARAEKSHAGRFQKDSDSL